MHGTISNNVWIALSQQSSSQRHLKQILFRMTSCLITISFNIAGHLCWLNMASPPTGAVPATSAAKKFRSFHTLETAENGSAWFIMVIYWLRMLMVENGYSQWLIHGGLLFIHGWHRGIWQTIVDKGISQGHDSDRIFFMVNLDEKKTGAKNRGEHRQQQAAGVDNGQLVPTWTAGIDPQLKAAVNKHHHQWLTNVVVSLWSVLYFQ